MKFRIRNHESTVTQGARIALGLKQLVRLFRLRAIHWNLGDEREGMNQLSIFLSSFLLSEKQR